MLNQKKHVTASYLIELSNEVGNAIVRSENSINQLKLTSDNYNFEQIWKDCLVIQFSEHDIAEEHALKNICQTLFDEACTAQRDELRVNDGTIDEDFIDDCINTDVEIKQYEWDF